MLEAISSGPDHIRPDWFARRLARQRTETHRWLLERGLHCPTLVFWAHKDSGASFELGKQLVEMFMQRQPRTELALFNRAGHYVYREYAEQFNRALHAFVTSCSSER